VAKKKPQDNERERTLIQLCGLIGSNDNRIGTDAKDEDSREYELKTTTKSGVSTARDVGLNHLAKWRRLIWICSRGHYDEYDTFHFGTTFLLFPEDLEPWFTEIEAKVTANDALVGRVVDLLANNGFNQQEIETLQYVFQRGVLLNDPNIPWSFIEANGKELTGDYAQALRKIVANRESSQSSTHQVQQASLNVLFEEAQA